MIDLIISICRMSGCLHTHSKGERLLQSGES